ncbi:MAG: hydrogenase subunit MbhD domain-containing protein, partial [Verrucomicrobiota bacterium]
MILTLFDCLLIGLLLFTAWRSIEAPTLFGCVVGFIGFGLIMAIAWLRLHAPDIALAEAAVGAGVTGALLLAA